MRPRLSPLLHAMLHAIVLVAVGAVAWLAGRGDRADTATDDVRAIALRAQLAAARDSVTRLRAVLRPQVETVVVQIDRWLPAAQRLLATSAPAIPATELRPVLVAAIETAGSCRAALTTCEALAAQHAETERLTDSVIADQRERIRRLTRGCRLLGVVACPSVVVGPSLSWSPAGVAGVSLTLGIPLWSPAP